MSEGSTRPEQLALLRAHCARPPHAVLFDEPAGLLYDVGSGKPLPLDLPGLAQVQPRSDAQSGAAYLLLVYGDGRQVALTEAGVAFAPSFENVGPQPELPAVVCWADFRLLESKVVHELAGHPDRAPPRELVALVMSCIAILDGARAVGFEVGREEQRLEGHLAELERRAGRP